MYRTQRFRLFGPKYSSSNTPAFFNGKAVMRGDGIGSMFAKFAKRIVPMAKKGLKAISKSQLAKDVSNILLDSG